MGNLLPGQCVDFYAVLDYAGISLLNSVWRESVWILEV